MKPLQTSFAYAYKDKDKVSTSTLENLRPFIPNIDVEKNFDLLPFACDACMVNHLNANDDSIDSMEAVAIYKSFIFRPTNKEHKRPTSFGFILNSNLTDLNNKVLTEEEVLKSNEPFYITLGGILWRLVDGKACDVIENTNDKDSPYYMGLASSWEIFFSDYDIILLPPGKDLLKDGEIISDAAEKEKLSKFLKVNDGSGKLEDGRRIGRILKGCSALGLGLTTSPASKVSGVAINVENTESAANKPMNTEDIIKLIKETINETLAQKSQENQDKPQENLANSAPNIKKDEKLENNCSQTQNTPVNENIIMKLSSLKDLTEENLKQVSVANVRELIEEELKKASEDFTKKLTEKETAYSEAQKVQKELAEAKEKLEKDLEKVRKDLQSLADENAKREKQDKFNDRMAKLNDKYNFNDKEKAVIAKQIRDLSDEAFASYEENADILFEGKLKTNTPATVQTSTASAQATVDAALETATKDKTQVAATTQQAEPTLKEKAQKAFGPDSYTLSFSKRNK